MNKQLLGQVERLRHQMNSAFRARNDMQHREVLELSQSLDELILLVQREKRPPKKGKADDREELACVRLTSYGASGTAER